MQNLEECIELKGNTSGSAVSILSICFQTVHNESNSVTGVQCFLKHATYITHNLA